MISFLLFNASFLNLMFYVFAIGFLISLGLEQWIKFRPLSVDSTMNERNLYIVQSNRRYCWRQAWITNLFWFLFQEICKHIKIIFGMEYDTIKRLY